MHRILENKISVYLKLQTVWGSNLVSHQWWFSVFNRPKVCLLIRCMSFLKNIWSIKTWVTSRQFSLQMRPAWPTKSDPATQTAQVIQPTFNPDLVMIRCDIMPFLSIDILCSRLCWYIEDNVIWNTIQVKLLQVSFIALRDCIIFNTLTQTYLKAQ